MLARRSGAVTRTASFSPISAGDFDLRRQRRITATTIYDILSALRVVEGNKVTAKICHEQTGRLRWRTWNRG